MRYIAIALILSGIIFAGLTGCSGSSSPVVPGTSPDGDDHQAAIDIALEGVEIQNTEILSVKLDGRELLPWGFRDVPLSREGSHPLQIVLANPGVQVDVRVEGATIRADGTSAMEWTGRSDTSLILENITDRIELHLEIAGDQPQVRDITVRTIATPHLPIPAGLGIVSYTNPETGVSFDIAEREIIIGVVEGTSLEVVEALVGALGCEILRAILKIDTYRLRIPADASYRSYIGLFEDSTVVKFAEPNCIHYPAIVPNDTYENYEYGNGLMDLYDAWDITTGTSSAIVAVVDSGIMRTHPDLAANVIPGEDFIDPPGDGLGGETPGDGSDNNNDGVVDGNVGHGSHCAGIIGAIGNNSEGVSGHTWSTQLLPCRVFPIDGDSGAMDTAVAEAIIYAADNGAIAISMSLGSFYGSGNEQAAINYAWAEGSVIVAAAGNSSTSANFYPAAFPHVIGVAATDSNDRKASFSNYGSYVDCCAPGVQIASSIFYVGSVPESERYALYNGTSMACPQVAGLVGLVASYFTSYTNAEVADQVIFTAENIDAQNPSYAGSLGTGRINAYRALTTPLEPVFEVVKLWDDDDNPLYSQGNRDGFINPGEIIEFRPTIRNVGTRNAPFCYMSITGGDDYIDFLFESAYFGMVNRGQTLTSDEPLIFRIDPTIEVDTMVDVNLHFEYLDGDPIDLPYTLPIRADLGVVDIITCSGESLIEEEIAKGVTNVPVMSFTIEGDLNYGTLDKLTIHQTGTADSLSFTEVQLWLDADDDGVFLPSIDTRIAYRSYDHAGFRGVFDDLNDPSNGFGAGIDYEEFPPVYFDVGGRATFEECVLPTAPGVPRTIFVITGIEPTAVTGDTVQFGILSTDDVIVKAPDQVNPADFPITTDEIPIVGTWLEPQRLTTNNPSTEVRYSWRPETAYCPVTGNVYMVFDSNRNGNFDVFIRRSTDQGGDFDDAIRLDSSGANEFYPDVQVDSMGTVHVVYYSTKISSRREIYYTRSEDFGITWMSPMRLTDAVRNSRLPKLAIGPDDSLNVAWHDDRTATDDYNIYFMRSEDGGDTWGSTVQIADTSRASVEVAIAVGGDGVIHVTWEEMSSYYYGNVYYARSDDNGINWSSPYRITSGGYYNHGWHSDVDADDIGNVFVVFHYVPLSIAAEVACRISPDSGDSWDTTFNLTDNTIPDSRPAIHVLPDTSYIDIVYRSLAAENWNIFHIYSDDGLATWEEPFMISNSTGGDATEPVVVRGDNYNIFAFWHDIVNAQGNYEVFYNRFLY